MCRQTLSNGSLIDTQGWLSPVVNPWSFREKGEKSPEAQAFLLAMHAGWRDWVATGSPGANAAIRATASGGYAWMVVITLTIMAMTL
jgi:hypothetical protein